MKGVLKSKKIIETNFCSVERSSDMIEDEDESSVHSIKLYFTENKTDGKRAIIDNGAPLAVVG